MDKFTKNINNRESERKKEAVVNPIPFADEYDVERLQLVTPRGRRFEMHVAPRYVERYVNNGYENYSSDLLVRLTEGICVFVDVGAHYGYYSLLLGTLRRDLEIFALEPVSATNTALRRNLERNELGHAKALCVAASDSDGSATLRVAEGSDSCGFHEHTLAKTLDEVRVATVTLDSLLKDLRDVPTVVKIDVEGHEVRVLRGMRQLCRRLSDVRLMVELNPDMLRSAGHSTSELIEELFDQGFDVFALIEDERRHCRVPRLDPSRAESYVKNDGYLNLLCVKRDRALSVCVFSHSSCLAGAERSLLQLVTELIRDHGILCTIVLPSEGPLKQRLEAVGAATLVAGYPWWCKPSRETEVNQGSLMAEGARLLVETILPTLEMVNPDVILTNTMVIPWGALSAMLTGKPHVWFVREFGDEDYGFKFISPVPDIRRFIKDSSNLVLTCSDAVRASLVVDTTEANVITVYMDIDLPSSATAATGVPYFQSPTAAKLLILGAVIEGKGQKDAILAVAELTARGHDVELLIVGHREQGYFDKLQAIVDERQLGTHVRFENFHDDPYPVIAAADVVLVCSRKEAFGRTALEAMLLGKPVIASNTGGLPEIVSEGVTGFLYRPGDAGELAKKIRQLIVAPELMQQMGKQGQEVARRRFTPAEGGGKVARLLLDLKDERNPSIGNWFTQLGLPDEILRAVRKSRSRDRDRTVRVLQAQLAERDGRIAAILSSTSWRLTRPLRWVGDTLRRMRRWFGLRPYKHYKLYGKKEGRCPTPDESLLQGRNGGGVHRLLRTARKIVTQKGGIRRTCAAALRVYRREGLTGIKHRIKRYIDSTAQLGPKSVSSDDRARGYLATYQSYFDSALSNKGPEFAPIDESGITLDSEGVKMIAFYLPQFHPIPLNNAAWGRGFTEWTNVSKATPQFVGHYQPHLPGEFGFYDLRVPETQQRQVELAKLYGIWGFCFHYYWFDGRRLLAKPIEQFVADKSLGLKFCLCWANENWTMRWDGRDQEVLIAQNHSAQDDIAFIKSIEHMLRDERYIRIGGRPVLIVYRSALLPDAAATAARWREYCRREGIGDLFLVAAQTYRTVDPRPFEFDAAVEFPPHNDDDSTPNITAKVQLLNPMYKGVVHDYADMVTRRCALLGNAEHEKWVTFRTVSPSWDNEARKPGAGVVFHGATPALYGRWLQSAGAATAKNSDPDARLLFINAWNEWAEGAHLEPDQKFGYAWLAVTKRVAKQYATRAP